MPINCTSKQAYIQYPIKLWMQKLIHNLLQETIFHWCNQIFTNVVWHLIYPIFLTWFSYLVRHFTDLNQVERHLFQAGVKQGWNSFCWRHDGSWSDDPAQPVTNFILRNWLQHVTTANMIIYERKQWRHRPVWKKWWHILCITKCITIKMKKAT